MWHIVAEKVLLAHGPKSIFPKARFRTEMRDRRNKAEMYMHRGNIDRGRIQLWC